MNDGIRIVKKIKKRIISAVLMLALFFGVPEVYAIAAGEMVVCTKSTSDAVYLYIRGNADITGGTVQIGNVLCDDVSIAPLVSAGMPVQTIFLLDNSLSLSSQFGTQAKEIMKAIVDGHMEGEQFKIATFSSEITDLSDFSEDYEAVNALIDNIAFENQDTYLTDILYAMLEQQKVQENANYLRIIIITDGADDNEITYTQDELTDLMKNCNIPIHTIGVRVSNNAEMLEQLFSYSRITKGFHFMVNSHSDFTEIYETMAQDYSMNCIRLVPDAFLMDGSSREVKLTLQTSEGEAVLTATVQMPFGTAVSVREPEEAVEESEVEEEEEVEEEQELPTIGEKPEEAEDGVENDSKSGPSMPVLIVVITGGVILAAGIATAVIFIVKKKKGTAAEETAAPEEIREALPAEEEKTVMLAQPSAQHGTTQMLWGTPQTEARQSYVILTDMNDPGRVFKMPINDVVRIGRKNADITIDYDNAVSGQHCEIIKKGELYYLNDLKSSNGTVYDGRRIYGETAIMENGVIEIGKQKFQLHFQ